MSVLRPSLSSTQADARRPLRIVLVDDEPPALRALRSVLAADPELVFVAECSDGESAIEAVQNHRPDILLLDIQMPEMDGFEVLRRLEPETIPVVVFVTAFDEHAVAAFEEQAIDYVLKPFTEQRLVTAIERAKSRVRGEGFSELGRRILALAEAGVVPPTPLRDPSPPLERLAVTKGDRTLLIEIDRIDWLEAADYYVRVHVGCDRHLIRRSLKWFEQQLDPRRFVRVHRSAIVNVGRIEEIRHLGHGDNVVVLPGERLVSVSRSGREALSCLLGI